MVAGDNIALLLHAQAAVGIAIVCKTDIQALLHNKLLEALDMSGASIIVDVQTIRMVIDDVGICSEGIEHRLGDVPGTTVGAVQTNLDALERVDTQRDQVAHVTVTARDVIHSTADMLTMSKRQFWPVLIEHIELAIDVILHQQQSLLRHFFTVAIDQLDAIIVVRIVAGGDHDTTVKVIHTGDIRHRRSCSDVEQIGICTGSSQACDQTVLEHIGTAASVLADYNACRLIVAVTLTQSIVIPS